MQRTIRIGTRGSQLALVQAHQVADLLKSIHGLPEEAVEIVTFSTAGDRIQDRALSEIGGKGLFTAEIEEALFSRKLDIAVHSMKDMPTRFPDGLTIDCLLEREDPRDAFLSPVAGSIRALPRGGRLGTSSLRRQAQVKALRPDLEVVQFRGNVNTRRAKLAAGEVDATLLAMAGLKRMGWGDVATAVLEPEDMLPAIAQGAIGIEHNKEDHDMAALLAPLNHRPTELRVAAERAFLGVLDGSCRTPIAGLAEITGDRLWFRGMVLTPDGARIIETEREGPASDAAALGRDAGLEVRAKGGAEFFKDL